MKNQKSKILKLESKKQKLTFWKRYGGWILCVNALIPISLLIPMILMAPVGLTISLVASLYLGASILASFFHELFGEKKITKELQNVDQQILELFKTNENEKQIYLENEKIKRKEKEVETKQQEIKKEKSLLKQMIKNNYIKGMEGFEVLYQDDENLETDDDFQILLTIEEDAENEGEFKLLIKEEMLENENNDSHVL